MLISKLDHKRDIYSNAILPTLSLNLVEFFTTHQDNTQLIITPDAQKAQQLYHEINYLLPDKNIHLFPDLEILPFDYFSASEDIHSTRLKTLYAISNHQADIILISATTLLKLLPPVSFIQGQSLVLKKGDTIELTEKRKILEMAGYRLVTQVLSRGEFSVRGSILDIFPMGANTPFRIDLFDDEVDSIRIFDIESQRSLSPINAIDILPANEFIFDERTLDTIAENWQQFFPHIATSASIYQDLMSKKSIGGIEFYLKLFYEQCANFFDYVPKNTIVHQIYNIDEAKQKYFSDIVARHEQLRYDRERPLLEIDQVYLPLEQITKAQKAFKNIKWLSSKKQKSTILPYQTINDIRVHYQYKEPYKHLLNFLESHHFKKVVFCADSIGRKEVLLENLTKLNIRVTFCKNWLEVNQTSAQYIIISAPFIEGFFTQDSALITEYDLFANHVPSYKTQKTESKHPSVAIKDLSEITPGAAVVHIEYGVGRYQGLTKLDIANQENEFLTLSYKNNEKLYVPIHDIHLVSRYSGTELEHAPLNKLGTEKWEKEKEKAAKKLNDVAAELLAIYAERNLKKGFANIFDEKAYLSFCEGFPFEETDDQLTAINDVIKDMIRERPMDRLVCGDVGFGKTEVAMRATFMAVHNNKQVAILAPTTLLAQQHYDNFKDRFSELGANVELLSRFKTIKEQNKIIDQLQTGTIDIIIGTHKLLSEKISFSNLGLLIIDEEHRFGVAHKEKMKAMRANIDILTMTATPIPRTLNMAFSAIRDLSVISTPPAKRLSVKTFIKERKQNVIREAILREVLRGGQVYYLHNQVDTIYDKADELRQLFPEYNIAVGHGQMRERELEKVMFEFQQNRYSILVCTTIIETGIDIANANTIIIERADNFGLAQLHQLRGRVGRSHHQAYAYLLTPPFQSLQKDAKKRLEAISETASIGGGFMLANHDLEIRGAGELLGKEQSGNMQGIGFNLYMDLLNKTIKALQNGEKFDIHAINQSFSNQSVIELRIPALLPEEYIFDVHTRLDLYKRISSAENHNELNDIKIEIIDRFGPLPDHAHYLFKVAHLKLDATSLGIHRIEMHSSGGKVIFNQPLFFDPMVLISFIQRHAQHYRINKDQHIFISATLKQAHERIEFIENFLQSLLKKQQ